MKFLNKLLPSAKLNTDIDIKYNSVDFIKPISLFRLSLIAPIKKFVLNLRKKNNKIIVKKTNKTMSLIVPYRHRKEHLNKFIPHMKKYLNKQAINYEIIIVEQIDNEPFNKAKLMNIGALNSSKNSDYFVFHDVDLLAENIDYRYCNHTQKLFTYIKNDDKYHEYGQIIFGGAISVPKEIFFDINGFSNDYWQWGSEDDDFFLRHIFKGYIPLYDANGKFTGLPHQPSINRNTNGEYVDNKIILKRNRILHKKNKNKFSNFKRGLLNQDKDGVSNIDNFQIESIIEKENIKTIKVSFQFTS